MLHPLISRSPDLQRLVDDGYEIEIRSGRFLLVHAVPYVTSARMVAYGTLVVPLQLAGDITSPPTTHVVRFIGAHPHRSDGTLLNVIQNETRDEVLEPGLTVNHTFSCKPSQGYPDYYQLVCTYDAVISGPAQALDPAVTAKTHKAVVPAPDDCVFHYADNASSNAGIASVAEKLAVDAIAIVGLGGTGSYVLDLVAKTPVHEIHLYDHDTLLQHNAFRAPGAPSLQDLRSRPSKVSYFSAIYSKMHKGIHPHAERIVAGNVAQLRNMAFVFLCIDDGPSRGLIANALAEYGTPFVDVGMGVVLTDGSLGGILRVTTSTPTTRSFLTSAGRLPVGAPPEDDYETNIQIADLNSLNASLAVIKWKKYAAFYRDCEREHYSTYTTDGNMLLSEDQQ